MQGLSALLVGTSVGLSGGLTIAAREGHTPARLAGPGREVRKDSVIGWIR